MIHKFRRLRVSSGLNFSSNLRSGVKKIAWSLVTSVEALWCLGRTCPGENYTQTYTDLLLLRPRIKDRLLSTRVTLCNILLYTSATGKFLRGWFETFCRCNFAMLSKFALLNFVLYSINKAPIRRILPRLRKGRLKKFILVSPNQIPLYSDTASTASSLYCLVRPLITCNCCC